MPVGCEPAVSVWVLLLKQDSSLPSLVLSDLLAHCAEVHTHQSGWSYTSSWGQPGGLVSFVVSDFFPCSFLHSFS